MQLLAVELAERSQNREFFQRGEKLFIQVSISAENTVSTVSTVSGVRGNGSRGDQAILAGVRE
jgi:hypothetical protein